MADKFSLSILLKLQDQLTAPLKRVRKEFKGLGRELKAVSKEMTQVGRTLTLGLTAPIALFGIASVKTAAEFQAAMNFVGAVTNATEKEFADLTAIARKMGATTQFSATEAASGLKLLGQAGLDAVTATKALPAVLELAASAQTDMGTAADIVTNIMAGFSIEVSKLGEVNDILVNTFTNSNTTLQEMGEAMKLVGPVASALGFDFNEVAASLGNLANAGIKGSEGGTAMRRNLSRLAAPTTTMKKLLKALNVQTKDAAGEMLGIADIVGQFEDAIERTGKKTAIAAAIMDESAFGQRGGPAFLALIGQGADKIEKLTAVTRRQGSAAKIAAAQMIGLPGALKLFISAFEAFRISLVSGDIGNLLNQFIRLVASLFQGLSELNPTILKWGVVFAGVLAIVGPLLVVIGSLAALMGVIGTSIGVVLGIAAALTLALTAWAVVLVQIVENWQDIVRIFKNLSFLEILTGTIKEFFDQWTTGLGIIKELLGLAGGNNKVNINQGGGGSAAAGIARQGVDVNNQLDVNLRVRGEGGATATVEGVSSSGPKANVTTEGFVGAQ